MTGGSCNYQEVEAICAVSHVSDDMLVCALKDKSQSDSGTFNQMETYEISNPHTDAEVGGKLKLSLSVITDGACNPTILNNVEKLND